MSTTRERIVTAGADLFRRQGYTGTGIKQIAADARAPFGSLYHHFPGGKAELGAAVIRWSGARYAELGPAILVPAPDAPTGVERFFAGAAEHLAETDYEDACPIATVALEVASLDEELRIATRDVFDSWVGGLAAYLAREGIAAGRAHELAVAFIAALEGAFVLARAGRTTEPLRIAGALVADAVRAELGA